MRDIVQALDQKNMRKPSPAGNAADRQPRKLENHRKLLAAARRLFVEQGSHQTTTHDIARLAGLVHGTFYSHFKDKTDCFIEVLYDVEQEYVQVMQWFSPPEDASPAEVIHSWLSSQFSYSCAQPGAITALLMDTGVLSRTHKRLIKTPPLGQKWIETAEKWKETGHVASDFDSKAFFILLQGVVRQVDIMITRNPERAEELTDQMTLFIVRAIKADETWLAGRGAVHNPADDQAE